MFGSHLSTAGGLHNALTRAKALGMGCVQIFTASPRNWPKPNPALHIDKGGTKNQKQWVCPPLSREQIDNWQKHQASTGVCHCVSHDSYLINLASIDGTIHGKSMVAFADEMLRCDLLGIPYLVTHPGAHLGQGEAAGLKRVAESLNRLHDAMPDAKVVTCLEITAGQGTSLGHRLEHLAEIIACVESPHRLGVCLDTAHLLAAGYDLTSEAGAKAVLKEVDAILGLDRVKVLHLNDSKVPRGKRVDRHEHIGHGHVAVDAFRVIVNHPRLKKVPKILETAKEDAPDGRPWDAVNLETLMSLVKPRTRPKAR